MSRVYKKQPRHNPARIRPALVLEYPDSARTIGYARVSTEEQVLDVQMTALRAADCDPIFAEKLSAADAKRPQFHLMMKFMEPGDTLVVYAFSRISRNLKQLLTILDDLHERDIVVRSTSEPHIDPRTTNGRLLVSVTGAVDENERGRVRDRTRDAMAEKKRQGMYLGRPRVVALKDIPKMRAMRKRGVSVDVIAATFKCSKPCVYSHTKATA